LQQAIDGGAQVSYPDETIFDEALEPLVDQFLTTDTQWQVYEGARALSEKE